VSTLVKATMVAFVSSGGGEMWLLVSRVRGAVLAFPEFLLKLFTGENTGKLIPKA
jgi:NADPH-dependent curcumin reductase CurA